MSLFLGISKGFLKLTVCLSLSKVQVQAVVCSITWSLWAVNLSNNSGWLTSSFFKVTFGTTRICFALLIRFLKQFYKANRLMWYKQNEEKIEHYISLPLDDFATHFIIFYFSLVFQSLKVIGNRKTKTILRCFRYQCLSEDRRSS